MLSADGRPMVGRLSADRKTLQLIKVIGDVCLLLLLQSADKKLYFSANKNAKLFSADYRPIVCLNVIAALKLDAQVIAFT